MNLPAFDLITKYRNKAIAVFRLQKVNFLAQELQELNALIKASEKQLTDNQARLSGIDSGDFQASLTDLSRFATAEEAKTEVVKDITKENEALTKRLEDLKKDVSELEEKITLAAKGEGKGNRYSRSEITRLASDLIFQDGNALDLKDVESQDNQD